MSDPINIDEIMQELRNNAKNKSYPKEAVAFDAVCARKRGRGFRFLGAYGEGCSLYGPQLLCGL